MEFGWWVIGPAIFVIAVVLWAVATLMADRNPEMPRPRWLRPRRGGISGGVHEGDRGSNTATGTVIGERAEDVGVPERSPAQVPGRDGKDGGSHPDESEHAAHDQDTERIAASAGRRRRA